jgi:hypothetical protein
VGAEEGDYRVALVAGFILMLVLSWFPPFGIIIAGFLIGFIAAKPKEGAIIATILAAVGALIQITFVTKVLPLLGVGLFLLGIIPLTFETLLSTFGPLSTILIGVGGTLFGVPIAGGLAIFVLYCILGAVGGFLGGLIKHR